MVAFVLSFHTGSLLYGPENMHANDSTELIFIHAYSELKHSFEFALFIANLRSPVPRTMFLKFIQDGLLIPIFATEGCS